jgi:hypothetical protein
MCFCGGSSPPSPDPDSFRDGILKIDLTSFILPSNPLVLFLKQQPEALLHKTLEPYLYVFGFG